MTDTLRPRMIPQTGELKAADDMMDRYNAYQQSAAVFVDLTEAEGAIVSAYALSQIGRGQRPARDQAIDKLMYYRAEWSKPQPESSKRNAFQNYKTALKEWREKRIIE